MNIKAVGLLAVAALAGCGGVTRRVFLVGLRGVALRSCPERDEIAAGFA
jgi:hypothetical protein